MYGTFEIIDLIHSPTERALALFAAEIENIRAFSKDQNRKNYYTLDRDFKKFECFHVLLQDGRLIAFSGVQPYSPSLSRVLSRTYYVPEARQKSLTLATAPGYSVQFLLPLQVAHAKKMGKDAVFISVQGDTRRPFVQYLQRHIKKMHPEQDWRVLEDFYLTHEAADKNCWQNIALLKFREDFSFGLPKITPAEWRKKFFPAAEHP